LVLLLVEAVTLDKQIMANVMLDALVLILVELVLVFAMVEMLYVFLVTVQQMTKKFIFVKAVIQAVKVVMQTVMAVMKAVKELKLVLLVTVDCQCLVNMMQVVLTVKEIMSIQTQLGVVQNALVPVLLLIVVAQVRYLLLMVVQM
jgi:hypothetical protein